MFQVHFVLFSDEIYDAWVKNANQLFKKSWCSVGFLHWKLWAVSSLKMDDYSISPIRCISYILLGYLCSAINKTCEIMVVFLLSRLLSSHTLTQTLLLWFQRNLTFWFVAKVLYKSTNFVNHLHENEQGWGYLHFVHFLLYKYYSFCTTRMVTFILLIIKS